MAVDLSRSLVYSSVLIRSRKKSRHSANILGPSGWNIVGASVVDIFTASAPAAGVFSVCAYAEDSPAGYVYFMASKCAIGQGFTVQPAKVPFYEVDTGADVVPDETG